MTNLYSVHYESGKDYSTKSFDNFEDALEYYFSTKKALEILYHAKLTKSIYIRLEIAQDSFDDISL